MDLRIRNNRELVTQLSYANSVIEICRTSIVRIDFDDWESGSASIQIDRMITNLETIKKYLDKEEALWRNLNAANKTEY